MVKHFFLSILFFCTAMFTGLHYTEASFQDVDKTNVHAANIEQLTAQGIINGYSATQFGPNDAVTREQVVLLLHRIAEQYNIDHPKRTYKPFNDIDSSYTYASHIQWAYEQMIIDGDAMHQFRPNDSVTRAEMAKMLAQFFIVLTNEQASFQDVSSTDWSYPYINRLYAHGITKINDGYYHPHQIVPREQIASFLVRSIAYYEKTYPSLLANTNEQQNDSTKQMQAPPLTHVDIDVLTAKPFQQYATTKAYQSGFSFHWYQEPTVNGLSLQGIENEQVVAQYIRGGQQAIGAFALGMSIDTLYSKFGTYAIHSIPYGSGDVYVEAATNPTHLTAEDRLLNVHTFQINDQIIRVWTDRLGQNEVVAVFAAKLSVYTNKEQAYTPVTTQLEQDYNALTALIYNQIRLANDVLPLKDETSLYNSVARKHSQDMIDRQYFAHISPEGARPWRRIEAGGVKNFGLSVEVIAAGQETPIHMMEALMQSSGHRQAMLNTTITHYIIGYAFRADNYAPYLTIDMYNYYK